MDDGTSFESSAGAPLRDPCPACRSTHSAHLTGVHVAVYVGVSTVGAGVVVSQDGGATWKLSSYVPDVGVPLMGGALITVPAPVRALPARAAQSTPRLCLSGMGRLPSFAGRI